MINLYKSVDSKLSRVHDIERGCWVSMIDPTADEIDGMARRFGLDLDVFESVLDLNERSRIEVGENYKMIILNIPAIADEDRAKSYVTVPISFVICEDVLITICKVDSPVLDKIAENGVPGIDTGESTKFILKVVDDAVDLFIEYLSNIERLSEEIESKLMQSTKNEELFGLLKLKKSLVYFTTAISSNKAVLEKMQRMNTIIRNEEEAELLEDVLVENNQALEMADIYSQTLSGTVDTFASIISNNLNIVMKVLAVVTIVLSVPTMIFSAYGMNLHMGGVPFGQHPMGFPIVTGLAVALCAVITWIFVKMKLF